MKRKLEKQIVELPQIRGVSMRVEHGRNGHRVAHIDRHDFLASSSGESHDLDIFSMRKATHRDKAWPRLLFELVSRRLRREEGQFRRHRWRHTPHCFDLFCSLSLLGSFVWNWFWLFFSSQVSSEGKEATSEGFLFYICVFLSLLLLFISCFFDRDTFFAFFSSEFEGFMKFFVKCSNSGTRSWEKG